MHSAVGKEIGYMGWDVYAMLNGTVAPLSKMEMTIRGSGVSLSAFPSGREGLSAGDGRDRLEDPRVDLTAEEPHGTVGHGHHHTSPM